MVRSHLDARRESVDAIPNPLDRARALLEVGASARALEELGQLPSSPARDLLVVRAHLARSEFVEVEPLLHVLRAPASVAAREALYTYMVLTNDLATLDAVTKERLAAAAEGHSDSEPARDLSSVVDLLAAGNLRIALLDPAGAETFFQQAEQDYFQTLDPARDAVDNRAQASDRSRAQDTDENSAERRDPVRGATGDTAGRELGSTPDVASENDELRWHAATLGGLAKVAHRRMQFDRAEELVLRAIDLDPLEVEHLVLYAEILIRLGRVDSAIEALELAVDLSPFHETAHYYLGNGYAKKNYTQLVAAYPTALGRRTEFGDSTQSSDSTEPGDSTELGDSTESGSTSLGDAIAVDDATPPAKALVLRGSDAFAAGRFREARDLFIESLVHCPEYGRAHNGLAKALEGERLRFEVHRENYETAFAAAPFPEIPHIEEFVVNWNDLTPRHQKRVAMAIAPWQRYVPALIAGGHTYYIKPLHELLSETPGQETLRDQRIDYDSRLWDDVRGCGGYHTVTGIEDVERSIFGRYDTVLHELTHQVHGIQPREISREIEEMYRQTKERDAGTGQAFLSRYAGGSVWEYFAEGANGLGSPRRDAYDTREIVRERLEAIDPALLALVRRLEDEDPVEPCLPVALVNRGYRSIEKGKPAEALPHFERALAIDSREPTALGGLVYGLLVADLADSALRSADHAIRLHPDDGSLNLLAASARRHAGHQTPEVIAELGRAREIVRAEDQLGIDVELGRLHWIAGSASSSMEAYDRVLARQQDHPEGSWGRANALALTRQWDDAWPAYDAAIRMRNGIAALRLDYARDLLRAGESERAKEQISAAELLDPEDPFVRAMRAWSLLDPKDPASTQAGWKLAHETAEAFDWCLLAKQVEARAAFLLGRTDEAHARLAAVKRRAEAPPSFVYREKQGRYDEVGVWASVERELSAPGGPLAID